MRQLLAPVLAAIFAGSVVLTTGLMAETKLPLRGDTPLTTEGAPPPIAALKNDLEREPRNYPEQPPLIPHTTDGYTIDLNSNKCLSCHARSRTPETKAPMVSITHFMDREGQFLATVSPRRYFCTQCHVPQAEVKAPVKNTFVDIDEVIGKPSGAVK